MRLEANAPAKINLTLEVLGRRADGFHEIASVMHTLSLYDTLTLELPDTPALSAEGGAIELIPRFVAPCSSKPRKESQHAFIPTDSRNLVWKAVAVFVNACPSLQPYAQAVGARWRATLTKSIPTQAGLGGGSSNAATTLKLLAEWAKRLNLPVPNLHGLAVPLGADVAFFLEGACALAQGRGEILEPLPALPPLWWVLAKPYGVGVPTGWAYAQLGRGVLEPDPHAPHTERFVNALKQGVIQTAYDLAPMLHNDFDEPILNAIPKLRTLRQRMEHAGALKVILCGSGAAQAALCESQKQAENLAETLIQEGYWAIATQTA